MSIQANQAHSMTNMIQKERTEKMNIDNFIAQLLNFKFLPEADIKDICEKVIFN